VRRSSAGRRDDRGAVAILVTVLALVLLVMAAFAVDLGNAYVAKRDSQKHADLAALAGGHGDNLPTPNSTRTCAYGPAGGAADQAVVDVAAYLQRALDTSTPTAANLVDCALGNGEVFYGDLTWSAGQPHVTYDKNKLTVLAPKTHVDFGFADVIGVDGTDVNGQATVAIRSPKFSPLPFYAFTGCDYGPQTLQQPNNGHSADALMLYLPGDTNNATLTGVTPSSYPAGTSSATFQPVDISGTNLTGVTEVGFFEPGNAVAGPAPVTTTAFTVGAGGTTIHLDDLPDQARGVTGVQQFWYVRVKKNGQWSPVYRTGNTLNAPQLTIGDPPLLCGQGSSSGNFGTLKLSNHVGGGQDKMGAANVALGLDHALNIYPVANRRADGTCSSAQPQTKLWPAEGTNCVQTDTGMSSNVATGGFLGVGSSAPSPSQSAPNPPGLLRKATTTTCGPGGTAATSLRLGVTINNDTLSCFFTSSTVHVGDIDNAAYAGPAVLSSDIYKSPRFGYVPVLPVQPSSGGSTNYQIIEFRPCFITDQPGSAMKGDPPSATNGVITDSNGVVSLEVIFINVNALPPPPTTDGTTPWQGAGSKILQLVN
jgi:hypothetical protein